MNHQYLQSLNEIEIRKHQHYQPHPTYPPYPSGPLCDKHAAIEFEIDRSALPRIPVIPHTNMPTIHCYLSQPVPSTGLEINYVYT